jgi:hypothetical protein
MSPPIENRRIGNVGDEVTPGISLFVVVVSNFVNL